MKPRTRTMRWMISGKVSPSARQKVRFECSFSNNYNCDKIWIENKRTLTNWKVLLHLSHCSTHVPVRSMFCNKPNIHVRLCSEMLTTEEREREKNRILPRSRIELVSKVSTTRWEICVCMCAIFRKIIICVGCVCVYSVFTEIKGGNKRRSTLCN